jgi:dienelactone hydrolase
MRLPCVSGSAAAAPALPGTQPLTNAGDPAAGMIEGINRFLIHQTEESIGRRGRLWHRDTSSPAQYDQSVRDNRAHLARMDGLADERAHPEALSFTSSAPDGAGSVVGRSDAFMAYAVAWPALRRFEATVQGEGLLLVPARGPVVADVIALPDADQTPEQLAGISSGIAPESQFARRLAESGCRVLIPTLISRSRQFSVALNGTKTNQTHREFVYRPAFEMGRHVIGYELQKVFAAVDFFAHDRAANHRATKIAVIGYGEGGLLALHAAALETRIDAAAVCGYFDSRQHLADEPVYRNLFGFLDEFGDAELATLILPRPLIVEACAGPRVDGPPATQPGERSTAAPGRIISPQLDSVKREVERARSLVSGLTPLPLQLVDVNDGAGPFGAAATLEALMRAVAPGAALASLGPAPQTSGTGSNPDLRQHRQVDQMQNFTQALVNESEFTRRAFWARADRSSLEKWRQSTAAYRDYFRDQIIGRFDQPLSAPNARTRRIYDTPQFTGYEVMLDVFPDVIESGILLVPRDCKPGERRPVVVCQHGLEGRPRDLADPSIDSHLYHQFAVRLAERGFITFSPQSPTLGEHFREIHRRANPLRKSLYSIIVAQHQQATDWLASLPFVDPGRIAFYGLSYGGKTAMYVVPLVDRYCLAVCSGNFNDWIQKVTALRFQPRQSYMVSPEYEMFEWDIGTHFNHADLAALIAPRPFMVERGHRDGGASDERVAAAYASVRLLYLDLGIADRTEIEFFDGPHTIHGVGTFHFLHKHLNWPEPAERRDTH